MSNRSQAAADPVRRWGDELRRASRQRLLRRTRLIVAAFGSIAILGLSGRHVDRALVVWNATASVPIGLYRIVHDVAPRRGDLIAVRLPDAPARMAAARHYLPLGVPLLKPVAAVTGDRICAHDDMVIVAGGPAVSRLRRDPAGRPLPQWSGCLVLGKQALFLLAAKVPGSFDGRYFGTVPSANVIGVARPIWLR